MSVVDLHEWMLADLASVRSKLFDTVIALVPRDQWRDQADGGGATLNGLLLHLARHQDLAVNAVIRDHEPLFLDHREALGLGDAPVHVGIAEGEDREATRHVHADALVDYVAAVFDRTETWLNALGTLVLDNVPHTDHRLTHRALLQQHDLPWLYRMWADKPIWWLVQWPVIGHGHAHVGEAIALRNRLGYSPF